MGNDKHNAMKAAFLWFYATATSTTTGDGKPKDQLEDRLRDLVNDALITAKQASTNSNICHTHTYIYIYILMLSRGNLV